MHVREAQSAQHPGGQNRVSAALRTRDACTHGRNVRALACMISTCRFRGLFWKGARIGELILLMRITSGLGVIVLTTTTIGSATGERLSPWVGIGCFVMGCTVLFI